MLLALASMVEFTSVVLHRVILTCPQLVVRLNNLSNESLDLNIELMSSMEVISMGTAVVSMLTSVFSLGFVMITKGTTVELSGER